MKTLKENFGRRIALIGGGIIAILVSLVIVASLSVQAKAADPNREEPDDPYNPNQNSLTSLVHAGDTDTFEATFNYTATPVSLGGSTVASDLAKMPTLTIPGLHLTVNAGVPTTDTSGATVEDRNSINKRSGAGNRTDTAIGLELQYAENGEVSGETYWSWDTAAQKCYFIQFPFANVISGTTWSTPGDYKYKVIESSVETEQEIDASQADYDLRILVSDDGTGTLSVTGYILAQNKHDHGETMFIDKKDPRRGFGNSNHLETYEPQDEETATEYYYGFTYSHELSAADQIFYVQKIVDNNAPDLTINFPITLSFYNESYTGATTEKPIGVIGEVAYADRFNDAANVTPLSAVNDFTWGQDSGGDYCWSASFSLKHLQRIVFNGTLAFGGSTSTLIPALTGYTCLEDLETAQTPPVDYSLYTAKAQVYTQVGPNTGQAQTWTVSGGTAADTKGPGKNMYATYWDYDVTGATAGRWNNNNQAYVSEVAAGTTKDHDNKVVITNIYDYNPTNLWLDILPYVVMIGIPIAAFVIWMLARRKKLNR